jgi:hypothetical protein
VGLRVRHEGRALDDGYSSGLVPGLHASADAVRLVEEIEFANARLAGLAVDPPGLYRDAREAGAAGELDRASWICLLIAYLAPTEDEDPFASIRRVLSIAPSPERLSAELAETLEAAELGPRSSHQRGSGLRTLEAYRQWLDRVGGPGAYAGDSAWTPQRRFARLFERLALPGLSRAGRYELLVSVGRLGVHELQADSLQLSGARSADAQDPTVLAAKRIFGIGDPLLLERRAAALAGAAGVPLEALDLALANWQGPVRATMGLAGATPVHETASEAALALGL